MNRNKSYKHLLAPSGVRVASFQACRGSGASTCARSSKSLGVNDAPVAPVLASHLCASVPLGRRSGRPCPNRAPAFRISSFSFGPPRLDSISGLSHPGTGTRQVLLLAPVALHVAGAEALELTPGGSSLYSAEQGPQGLRVPQAYRQALRLRDMVQHRNAVIPTSRNATALSVRSHGRQLACSPAR